MVALRVNSFTVRSKRIRGEKPYTVLNLSDVLQAPQKLLVVQADANDVVRVDATGWVDTGTTTTVDNHTYALWSNAGAHLWIDQSARVQAVI